METEGTHHGSQIVTPHDSVFKQFLTHPETARDFLQIHLPPKLQAICDLTTLKLESGSFVEESLRPYYSDVLYSLKTSEGDGFIHVLIEHQSSPDEHMAFRLLRYAIASMQRHIDAGYKKLPLVIPILFYAGKRSPYPYSTCWLDSFVNPALAEELYAGPFLLVDVSVIPDDEIMHHRSMAALTLLQKHIYQRDMTKFVDRLAIILNAGQLTRQQMLSLLEYLVLMGETPNAYAFVNRLAQQVPKHKEELMTIAQQLERRGMETGLAKGIQQGMEKGIEQGIEQGLVKGYVEGRLDVARSLLKMGISRETVLEATRLTEEELAQIHH